MTITPPAGKPAATATRTAAPQPAASRSAAPGRTWSISTTRGLVLTGHLPAWADEDPSQTDVPLEKLATKLADIAHWSSFDGQTMRVHHPPYADSDTKAGEGDEDLFNGNIVCYPYSQDTQERTPFANVRVIDDFWMNHLTPHDLTTLALKLRAQAHHLEHDVIPTLQAAREDWATHHPERPLTTSALPPAPTQAEATARPSSPSHHARHTDHPEGR